MKVKVPRQIKLGTHLFDIIFSDTVRSDEGLAGLTHHRKQIIEIEKVQPLSQKAVILLHEVLHIIDRQYGCELEERNVDRVAQGIAEFLMENLGIEFDWQDVK